MIATSGCGDDYAVIAAIRDARSNHGRARRNRRRRLDPNSSVAKIADVVQTLIEREFRPQS
jgi:hypothetical protein